MRKTILTFASLALLAAAPAAHAEADRSGTVGPSSPSYAWDGGPGTSIGVNTGVIGGASVGNFAGCIDGIADCENTLIKVEAPGTLTVTADSADDSKDVLDLYLYETNEAGEFDDQATDISEGGGAGTSGDEKIVAKVKPGFYMAHIKFFLADADTYKGLAVLSDFPAPPAGAAPPAAAPPSGEPAPAPQSQPAPQQQSAPPAQPQNADQPKAKKKSKKAACQKKAKKIKNKGKRKKALKKCSKIKG